MPRYRKADPGDRPRKPPKPAPRAEPDVIDADMARCNSFFLEAHDLTAADRQERRLLVKFLPNGRVHAERLAFEADAAP